MTQDKNQISAVLQKLNLSEVLPCLEEYTDIGYGLDTAVDLLSPYSSSSGAYPIVLVSDGYANYGYPDPLTSVDNAVKDAITAEVPIYTIHVAEVGLDSNPALLQRISNETGGKFFDSTNYDELQKAFETLGKYETPTSTWNAKVEINTTIPEREDLGNILMIGAVTCIAILWIGNYRHYKTWF